jgi:hypothetical protein
MHSRSDVAIPQAMQQHGGRNRPPAPHDAGSPASKVPGSHSAAHPLDAEGDATRPRDIEIRPRLI